MASTTPACLFQETRLNLEPAFPDSIVDIQVPSHTSFFSSRSSAKRRRLDRPTISYNEDVFANQHLASESAIHFRPLPKQSSKQHPEPRSILWRVLNERKLLELQAVDLLQNKSDKNEPVLTLRFHFNSPICPSGIVFPLHEIETPYDTVVVFVLSVSGELFTLRLKKDFFAKPALIEESSSWCRSCSPSAFGYRNPFVLFAQHEKELWTTLTDGSLVRMDGEDGSTWRESFFTQGGWMASVRGLIPWGASASVRFENADLHSNTAVSLDWSPDGAHVWTVCLDHTLKAWNTSTGKLVFIQDLAADPDRDLQKPAQHMVVPSRAKLLQIVPSKHRQEYFIVTFSPPTREFKIWTIRDIEAPEFGWDDACPNIKLVPPIEELANTSIWSLQGFHIVPWPKSDFPWRLWILARVGSKCHVYRSTLGFHPRSKESGNAFSDDWVAVDSGFNSVDALKHNFHNPGGSEIHDSLIQSFQGGRIVDQWIEFLFYPGRFTAATLETALVIYCQNLGQQVGAANTVKSSDSLSLQMRICESVASSVQLNPADRAELAYEKYQRSVAAQWKIFYGVVQDLHGRRESILSLSFDHDEALPWLAMADSISPLRTCSECEILWHNRLTFSDPEKFSAGNVLLDTLSDARNSYLGQLFYALDEFRSSLPKEFQQNYDSVLKSELLDNSLEDPSAIIHSVYEKSGFNGQVSDDDYNNLTQALSPLGGFGNLDNDMLTKVLEFLDEAQKGRSHKNQLTRYGARALIRGSQEIVELGYLVLFDFILLLTFIAEELEKDDLPDSFDAVSVSAALLARIKEYNLLRWLASTTYYDAKAHEGKSSSGGQDSTLNETGSPQIVATTLLENIFIGDWATIRNPSMHMPDLLTYWCRAWAFGPRLPEQYDKIVYHVLGMLVKSGDVSLASAFRSFLPETPWAEYLTGRLCLVMSEFTEAAIHFKASANGLVESKHLVPSELDSAGLLDAVERSYINHGYAKFYQHIIDLFEHHKAPTYVSEFAILALSSMSDEHNQDAGLKTDLLSRLFSGCLKTSRYQSAFNALVQHTDLALRRASLISLISTLLKADQTYTLLNLPYPADLVDEVDHYLMELTGKSVSSHTSKFLGAYLSEPDVLQYHKLLYAFRLQRNDLRGAASALWQHLDILRQQQRKGLRGEDVDEEVAQTFLALINILSLMDADQAWILSKPMVSTGSVSQETQRGHKVKRKVITLDMVRSMWQEELDRAADVAAGRFSFGARISEEMEIEA